MTKIYLKFSVDTFGEPKFNMQMIMFFSSSRFLFSIGPVGLRYTQIEMWRYVLEYVKSWGLFWNALLLPSFFHV